MDTLQELQNWYQSHCDGDWEHSNGVTIGSVDNPGWTVTVDLGETDLSDRAFSEIRHQMEHESDWMLCRVVNQKFEGAGGPLMLEKILRVFLDWAAQ